MRVLVVEDDKKLARLIEQVLVSEQIDVDLAFDGVVGLEQAISGVYDVAVIDWMLPGRDGPAICRALRNQKVPTALLMLTARTQVEDRVAGLDSGADDYLTKPFAFDELLARLRALSRRSQDGGQDSWELRFDAVVLDLRARTARVGDQRLDLTPTEWRIMEFLLRHPGQSLSRRQILEYVWGDSDVVRSTQVDVFVSRLRSKVRRAGAPDPIRTVWGVGYRLGD
jgi:two-component system OmpR family response regulator